MKQSNMSRPPMSWRKSWRKYGEVLDIRKIGVNSNFYEIGGTPEGHEDYFKGFKRTEAEISLKDFSNTPPFESFQLFSPP